MLPLVGLIFFMGIYPKPLLERIEPSVKQLLEHVERNSDYRQPEPRPAGGRGGRRVTRAARPGLHVHRAAVDWLALSPAPGPGRRGGSPAGRSSALTPALAEGRLRRPSPPPPRSAALVLTSILWYQVQDDGP